MHIRVLGAHNIETVNTRLASVLIDDLIALDAGSLSSSLTLEQQKALAAIFITHWHFDHTKDLPLLGLATAGASVTHVYALTEVLSFIADHLLDGRIYPRLFESPSPDRPSLLPHAIEPLKPVRVLDKYTVKAIPVNHGAQPSVGYEVACDGGESVFYTGDTGPGLTACWQHTTPRLLLIETTLPDNMEKKAIQSGHLTPRLLENELAAFLRLKGYLPSIAVVHHDPAYEEAIVQGLIAAASRLNADIRLAGDGMELEV